MLNWSQNKKKLSPKCQGNEVLGREAINKCAGTELAAALGGGGRWATS